MPRRVGEEVGERSRWQMTRGAKMGSGRDVKNGGVPNECHPPKKTKGIARDME